MSANDIHGIQQGWTVKSSDGQSIGAVEETTHRYILVKSGLLGGDKHYLPAASLAHVRPELDEIGVSLTRDEFEAGDWSQEPMEPPRAEGAPINEDAYPEIDPLTATIVAERDRPPSA